jgi:iron(III) transport system ATP-binding protein
MTIQHGAVNAPDTDERVPGVRVLPSGLQESEERADSSAAPMALSVRGVAKAFHATRVLDGVDLDVAPGSVVALVGPSGCGKTTLVRVVAGFERSDAGRVELAGRPVAGQRSAESADDGPRWLHVAPERRRVGVVPQEGALFTHLDVAGNIGFGLARRGRTRAGRARVEHMLELVGLAGLGARRPDQLSGGQQQRVAVARALAGRPDLVLLDEPFSALDAALRLSVREAVMSALRAEAASVLLVTHDQDEALSVADRVAVMLAGRIAQVGTPDEVYARPATEQVARFLGEAVLLPGRAAGSVVRTELGDLPVAQPADGAVSVLLRPEQLVPEPMTSGLGTGTGTGTGPGAGAGGEGAGAGERVVAHVTGLSFHGHDALVGLRTERGTALQARMLGGWLPAPGDRVGLRVRGQGWVLPA